MGVTGKNPAGQEHHHDALAASLGVPDDAASALMDMLLSGLDAEVLMHPRQLLDAGIEEYEVTQELDQPFLPADLEQVLI